MTARARVLVVDDVVDQLDTICRGLFLLGIDCVRARRLPEALAQLGRPDAQRIDLLLADLTRPGQAGSTLIERVRAVRPDLPVLVITGLAPTPEVIALRARGIPILRKPFSADQLGQAIQAQLGRRP